MAVRVIAHRGGAGEAPENTLHAFRRAAALGVDAVECDVHLSADGIVVVHHDPTIRIAPGTDPVAIDATPGRDVLAADLGWTLGPDGAGHHPPRLEALLDAVSDVDVMVELKPGPRPEALGAAVGSLASGAGGRTLLASYDARALAAAHAASPRSRLLGVARPGSPTEDLAALPLAGWALEQRLVDAARVREAAARGAFVWAWTVTPAAVPGLVAAGVAGVITDVPEAVLAGVR